MSSDDEENELIPLASMAGVHEETRASLLARGVQFVSMPKARNQANPRLRQAFEAWEEARTASGDTGEFPIVGAEHQLEEFVATTVVSAEAANVNPVNGVVEISRAAITDPRYRDPAFLRERRKTQRDLPVVPTPPPATAPSSVQTPAAPSPSPWEQQADSERPIEKEALVSSHLSAASRAEEGTTTALTPARRAARRRRILAMCIGGVIVLSFAWLLSRAPRESSNAMTSGSSTATATGTAQEPPIEAPSPPTTAATAIPPEASSGVAPNAPAPSASPSHSKPTSAPRAAAEIPTAPPTALPAPPPVPPPPTARPSGSTWF